MAFKPFESVAEIRYVRLTMTSQNCIYEEIMSRLKFGGGAGYMYGGGEM